MRVDGVAGPQCLAGPTVQQLARPRPRVPHVGPATCQNLLKPRHRHASCTRVTCLALADTRSRAAAPLGTSQVPGPGTAPHDTSTLHHQGTHHHTPKKYEGRAVPPCPNRTPDSIAPRTLV